MKTVQDWLREADIEKIIDAYFYEYPIEYERRAYVDRYVGEIRESRRRNFTEYVERLKVMDVKSPDDGHQGLLFVYRVLRDDIDDIEADMVHLDELMEKGIDATGYTYEFTPQAEIMGFLVADTRMTHQHIYELLAKVLFEASFFGYEQEHLEEELNKLIRRTEDIKNGTAKYIPWETIKAEMEEKLGPLPDEESPDERELHDAALKANYTYTRHSRDKELTNVLEMIKGEKKR